MKGYWEGRLFQLGKINDRSQSSQLGLISMKALVVSFMRNDNDKHSRLYFATPFLLLFCSFFLSSLCQSCTFGCNCDLNQNESSISILSNKSYLSQKMKKNEVLFGECTPTHTHTLIYAYPNNQIEKGVCV